MNTQDLRRLRNSRSPRIECLKKAGPTRATSCLLFSLSILPAIGAYTVFLVFHFLPSNLVIFDTRKPGSASQIRVNERSL